MQTLGVSDLGTVLSEEPSRLLYRELEVTALRSQTAARSRRSS